RRIMQNFINMVYNAVVSFLGIFENRFNISHPTSAFCSFVLVIIVITTLLIKYIRLLIKYKKLKNSIN
ncbi:MAG: hypothetical protein WC358_11825, partial [Ignavibacteria bacterium]